MAASKYDIQYWFDRGKTEQGARYMVIVCDTYDWEDYPVYAQTKEDAETTVAHYRSASMQQVMEVYDLEADMQEQLNQHRTWAL